MVRMPPCHGGGRGFESRPVREASEISGAFFLYPFTVRAMEHFVYIICSEVDGTYYKGYTMDPGARLEAHNRGESQFTRGKLPWRLVYVQSIGSKKEALIRERVLKKYSRNQIEELIKSGSNELKLNEG